MSSIRALALELHFGLAERILAIAGESNPTVQALTMREEPISFRAADGVDLAGTWWIPDDPVKSVVVVAPGGGIPARKYRALAQGMAKHGLAVLTFDYRGIGRSRSGHLKALAAGIETWAQRDLDAALSLAASTYPGVPLGVVAHSIACAMVGASAHASKVDRAVFLAPHVAFWRDYYLPWRYLLLFVWHGVMPALTLARGYFPGSTLGLGEDLPKRFALQWATLTRPGCRPGRRKSQWDEILASHRRLRAPTLAISVPHDAFAPPAAARRMEPLYPGLAIRFETATPEQLGCRRLGHMSFLRRTTGPYFWARAAAWILQQERDADMVPPVTPWNDRHRACS